MLALCSSSFSYATTVTISADTGYSSFVTTASGTTTGDVSLYYKINGGQALDACLEYVIILYFDGGQISAVQNTPVIQVTREAFSQHSFTVGGEIVVNNQCGKEMKLTAEVGETTTKTVKNDAYTVPVRNICSVDVTTDPVFNLAHGEGAQEKVITTASSVPGVLMFSPGAFSNEGGRLENGNDYIGYTVTNATWGGGYWLADLSSEHAVQINNVPESVPGGKYLGSMTVQIQCE